MVKNNRSILVQDNPISISTINEQDYISLTDMLKAKDGDFFITDWLRNRNTLEFIGIWEQINNPNFNYGEFAIISSPSHRWFRRLSHTSITIDYSSPSHRWFRRNSKNKNNWIGFKKNNPKIKN